MRLASRVEVTGELVGEIRVNPTIDDSQFERHECAHEMYWQNVLLLLSIKQHAPCLRHYVRESPVVLQYKDYEKTLLHTMTMAYCFETIVRENGKTG